MPLDIAAKRTTEISGRVLDVNGKALVHVPISLVLAGEPLSEMLSEDNQKDRVKVFHVTNQQGGFNFSHLPPGRYLLVINRLTTSICRLTDTNSRRWLAPKS